MTSAPQMKDSYMISEGVFYLLGIIVVVPFNFYINSIEFWMYKFSAAGMTIPIQTVKYPPLNLIGLYRKLLKSDANTSYSRDGKNGTNDFNFKATTSITQDIFFQQLPIESRRNLNDFYIDNSSHFVYKQYDNLHKNITPPENRNALQQNFTSAFCINFKTMLLLTLLFCTIFSKKLPPPEKRLMMCLMGLSCLFFTATILTQINSDRMTQLFFAVAMISAALLNCFSGIALASLYQLITKFPPNYYASILSGHNISAIISSFILVILITLPLTENQTAVTYFSCGTTILIFTTIYYQRIVKNSKCFIYSIEKNQKHTDKAISQEKVRIIQALLKVKWYYATHIVVEGTTHLVYPGLVALVVAVDSNSLWAEAYFVPVITFLGFPVCTLIGRETARIIKTPKHSIILFVIAVLRIGMVPLLIFCNAQPRKHLPVYLNDNLYILILSIFGFSDGILTNKSIVLIPTLLNDDEKHAVMVLLPLLITVTRLVTCTLSMFITNAI